MKFATPLKHGVHALYGIPTKDEGFFEDMKDTPQDLLLGATPREAYIRASEEFLKRFHGKEVLGELFLRRVQRIQSPSPIVVSDCGFPDELQPLYRAYDPMNICLVLLYRPGTSYANDSRGYINIAASPKGVLQLRVDNNSTISKLRHKIRGVLDAMEIKSR